MNELMQARQKILDNVPGCRSVCVGADCWHHGYPIDWESMEPRMFTRYTVSVFFSAAEPRFHEDIEDELWRLVEFAIDTCNRSADTNLECWRR